MTQAAQRYERTSYPTGDGTSMIGGRRVYSGPTGYRVKSRDDGMFMVVSYAHTSEQVCGPMGMSLTEGDAHALALRLANAVNGVHTAVSVAETAARMFGDGVTLNAKPWAESVHGPDGEAVLTLANGFGVSLITRDGDRYPEAYTFGPAAGIQTTGPDGTRTDPAGNLLNCDAKKVVDLLRGLVWL